MAIETVPTASLLSSLREALESANDAFPTDLQTLQPPADGISLLDIKNELLLSYLQNLTFLILLRLRDGSKAASADGRNPNEDVVRKLTELRVYIDRGVRPLEGRLKYQIDKVVRAAEDVERSAAQKQKQTRPGAKKQPKIEKAIKNHDNSDLSRSGSESEQSDAEHDEDEDEEDQDEMGETLHRPNALALAQQMNQQRSTPKSSSLSRTKSQSGANSTNSTNIGTYKPPRITPTSMPTPQTNQTPRSRQHHKSTLLNEYIDEELSSAPRAQPSIGSNGTIMSRGRREGLSTAEREKQRERIEYEEKNFVRLPGESKAEKRKARLRGDGAGNKRDMFGGEDWTGLGGLGDRINRSVQMGKGGSGSGNGRAGVLERREKRSRSAMMDGKDGPRGSGLGIGEAFTKRQKIMEDRAERKRRKRE